jgi:hypothetical protein
VFCGGGWNVTLVVHGVKDLWPLEREDDPDKSSKDVVDVRQHAIQQPVFGVDAAVTAASLVIVPGFRRRTAPSGAD